MLQPLVSEFCILMFSNTFNVVLISVSLFASLTRDSFSIHLSLPNMAVGRCRDSSVVQRWAKGWVIGGLGPGRGWEFFSS
jgi:hypothetical protein